MFTCALQCRGERSSLPYTHTEVQPSLEHTFEKQKQQFYSSVSPTVYTVASGKGWLMLEQYNGTHLTLDKVVVWLVGRMGSRGHCVSS